MKSDFYVDLKQYRKIQHIGTGAFYEKTLIENYIPKLYIAYESTNKDLFNLSEIEDLVKEQYPSLNIPVGYSKTNFEEKDYPTILFDYRINGTLSSLFELPGIDLKRDTTTYIILLGIALAIRHLHRQNKSLLNLNPNNIFLDDFLRPHVTYFGETTIPDSDLIDEINNTNHELPLYLSPEILQRKEKTYKSDAYSFSLIAYQIITGQIPYENLSKKKDVKTFIEKVSNGLRPNVHCIPDGPVKSLLVRCWNQKPEERPGFDDIIETLTSYPFYKVFEVDHNACIKYLSEFGHECNVPLEIFDQNNPDIGRDEIEFLITETGLDEQAIMAANSVIENGGVAARIGDGEKDFDSMVTMLMYGGHKRRTMEIYLYFANKKNVDFNEELNRILGIAGFADPKKDAQQQAVEKAVREVKYGQNEPPDSSNEFY